MSSLERQPARASGEFAIGGNLPVAHLEENVAAALIGLTADQIRQLDTAI